MTSESLPLPTRHGPLLDRFVAVCQADDRVVAAFLGGSHAAGTADQYSDLDLCIITTDAASADFAGMKYDFLNQVGDALNLEDFGSPSHVFAIFEDGTECDVTVAREGDFREMLEGPYRSLVDKRGLLTGISFSARQIAPSKQVEALRLQVAWFWHDFGHLLKALERDDLWFAQGELEILRGICVNLARLRHNFNDPYTGQEPYFKVERAMPVEQLDQLRATFGPLDRESLVRSAHVLLSFYRELATGLTQAHGLEYPTRLDALFTRGLDELA